MNKKSDLSILRHSAAHLLGHAVFELFPKTLLTIGPATKDGFFYDCVPQRSFKEEDLIAIRERMLEIVARDLPLEHKEISKTEARKLYAHNKFKLELIDQIPGETVGLATQGNFYDLCRGGHVATTGELQHFVLLNISGSYWRADRTKDALQRISGTAFYTAEDLAAYLKRQEELIQYDHRTLGKQLDLFSFHDEGAGFPFFHPKGKSILNTITAYMRSLKQHHNYQEISTPTMLSDHLWRQSGHYEHYKENMYFLNIDEQCYAVKPMNCPGAILTYKTRPRSYRELPLKLAEFGHVHRHELSGALHGLLRVRAFTQDDAHIFCTQEQLKPQIIEIITILRTMLQRFGFHKISFFVETRPASSIGNDELWKLGTETLCNALTHVGLDYKIEEGGGAFYGPKIGAYIEDSYGRQWQCGTVQIDFFQPENFDLSYIAPSGERMRPVIIHQALYGSLERFFAIITEHYRGNFPLWLAPIQARVMAITDAQQQHAEQWYHALKEMGIRAELDETSDPIKAKIKDASIAKIPWMVIIGAREAERGEATLRLHNGTQHANITPEQLLKMFLDQTQFTIPAGLEKSDKKEQQ